MIAGIRLLMGRLYSPSSAAETVVEVIPAGTEGERLIGNDYVDLVFDVATGRLNAMSHCWICDGRKNDEHIYQLQYGGVLCCLLKVGRLRLWVVEVGLLFAVHSVDAVVGCCGVLWVAVGLWMCGCGWDVDVDVGTLASIFPAYLLCLACVCVHHGLGWWCHASPQ